MPLRRPSSIISKSAAHQVTAILAGAAVAVVLDVDVDRVLEVAAELLRLFLGQGVACDNCDVLARGTVGHTCGGHTFECLLDVDGLLRTGLEVGNAALGLAEGHRALGGNLQQPCQRSVSLPKLHEGIHDVPLSCSPQRQPCCRGQPRLQSAPHSHYTSGSDAQRGSYPGRAARPGSGTRPSSCPAHRSSWSCSRRTRGRSSRRRGRMPRPGTGSAPGRPCPRAVVGQSRLSPSSHGAGVPTCIVTCLSSTMTSLVRKSAPMVAL